MSYYLSEMRRIQAQEGAAGSKQVGQPTSHPLCVSPLLWTSGTHSPSPGERCPAEEFRGYSASSPRSHTSRPPSHTSFHSTQPSAPEGGALPRISNPGLVQSGGVLSFCQCGSTYLNVICYCGLQQRPQLKPKQDFWLPCHGSKDSPQSYTDQMLLSTPCTSLAGPDG